MPNWLQLLSVRLPRRAIGSTRAVVRKLIGRRRMTPAELVDETFKNAMAKIRRGLAEKQATLPVGSPMHQYVGRLLGLADEPLMDEICSHTNANPKRTDCPPYRVLLELAARARPLDDPAWGHVLNCFPCSTEVRTMHRAHEPRPS